MGGLGFLKKSKPFEEEVAICGHTIAENSSSHEIFVSDIFLSSHIRVLMHGLVLAKPMREYRYILYFFLFFVELNQRL